MKMIIFWSKQCPHLLIININTTAAHSAALYQVTVGMTTLYKIVCIFFVKCSAFNVVALVAVAAFGVSRMIVTIFHKQVTQIFMIFAFFNFYVFNQHLHFNLCAAEVFISVSFINLTLTMH